MAEPAAPRFRIYPTRDKTEVIMFGKGGEWRQRVPAADLPRWITLYRGLRDREKGAYAQHYAQPVQAMEAVARDLGIPLPVEPKPNLKVKK